MLVSAMKINLDSSDRAINCQLVTCFGVAQEDRYTKLVMESFKQGHACLFP
jgi:hypothetical protein